MEWEQDKNKTGRRPWEKKLKVEVEVEVEQLENAALALIMSASPCFVLTAAEGTK